MNFLRRSPARREWGGRMNPYRNMLLKDTFPVMSCFWRCSQCSRHAELTAHPPPLHDGGHGTIPHCHRPKGEPARHHHFAAGT